MTEVTAEQQPAEKKKIARKSNGRRQPEPIHPTAIYDRPSAARITDCSVFSLMRAYDAGHLSAYRVGRHVKHSGQHLLDWLEAGGKTA